MSPIDRGGFETWLRTLKGDPGRVRAHAIVDPPGESCPSGDTDGREYARYTEWTGGALLNLCAQDYSALVDSLGRVRFTLSQPAVAATLWAEVHGWDDTGAPIVRPLSVCIGEEPWDTCGLAYDEIEARVELARALQVGEQLVVRYEPRSSK